MQQADLLDNFVVDARIRRRAIAKEMERRCYAASAEAPRCHCGALLLSKYDVDGYARSRCINGHEFHSPPLNPVVWCAHCRKFHALDRLVNSRRVLWEDAGLVIVGECPAPIAVGRTRPTLSLPIGAYGT